MNIFGIGGAEFIVILIIMLIIAGPKRMATWAVIGASPREAPSTATASPIAKTRSRP